MEPFVSTDMDHRTTQERVERSLEKNPEEEVKSRHAITIRKNPSEVFAFFRDFKNLPLFVQNLRDIQILSEKRSHWILQIKSGATVEWDAEILQEIPDQLIAWRSVEGSEVETAGTIHFEKAPAELGTVVSLAMDYSIPGGKLTEFTLLFTGESPELVIMRNLMRLKAYIETGEIPTIQGQPHGGEEEEREERPEKGPEKLNQTVTH
ncbi:MAG: SRPBCC family protein [Pseudobdellovibrionaceae bacterium]